MNLILTQHIKNNRNILILKENIYQELLKSNEDCIRAKGKVMTRNCVLFSSQEGAPLVRVFQASMVRS